MKSKLCDIESALDIVQSGMSIMVGGFGVPGTPFTLLENLAKRGLKDLTLIKNDANEDGMGVDWLLQSGAVRKYITSHIGLNRNAQRLMNEGRLEVEFAPQGILAERIRAGGAGLKAIVTDIGLGTEFAEGKTEIELDGAEAIIEPALRADIALIHADRADIAGNLTYAASARNFNPLMAMAAGCVIVEAENISALGEIAPEAVHTPSPFVDHIVELKELSEFYHVIRR